MPARRPFPSQSSDGLKNPGLSRHYACFRESRPSKRRELGGRQVLTEAKASRLLGPHLKSTGSSRRLEKNHILCVGVVCVGVVYICVLQEWLRIKRYAQCTLYISHVADVIRTPTAVQCRVDDYQVASILNPFR